MCYSGDCISGIPKSKCLVVAIYYIYRFSVSPCRQRKYLNSIFAVCKSLTIADSTIEHAISYYILDAWSVWLQRVRGGIYALPSSNPGGGKILQLHLHDSYNYTIIKFPEKTSCTDPRSRLLELMQYIRNCYKGSGPPTLFTVSDLTLALCLP